MGDMYSPEYTGFVIYKMQNIISESCSRNTAIQYHAFSSHEKTVMIEEETLPHCKGLHQDPARSLKELNKHW
jgi:hypothetical protein